jgi:hypothetical protein
VPDASRCHTLGAGEVGLDLGELGAFDIQFALQRAHLAQPRFRVSGTAALVVEVCLHPVEGMLQPGDDPGGGRLVVNSIDWKSLSVAARDAAPAAYPAARR